VRADSERELAAASQRRDSINAQLANVRQMLATLTGGAAVADPVAGGAPQGEPSAGGKETAPEQAADGDPDGGEPTEDASADKPSASAQASSKKGVGGRS
jgi:hypothetical protein